MSKKRLVVCLDGTWNNSDDSTNVLQHFALALKGLPEGEGSIRQKKHYIEGVGTGVLDGITGGAFGFGLEENVRKAYDWLIANFHDGDTPEEADDVYIFGFSRGAYTARSLVGFISTCGLLRRGAPLSVNQLWQDYCLLGRERENRTSVWDRVITEQGPTTRRISDLICDPWNIATCEAQRSLRLPDIPSTANDRVPGQLVDDLKGTERLLVRWSRRVRITYLGVYDTVGALGLDALAIPGLRSRLAMHHNMRVTTIVQHCRHALAIDEHRSSFAHTPLAQYLWHGDSDDDKQSRVFKSIDRATGADDGDSAKYWRRQTMMWERKIEQRWFVGAHSNVGGGYPDNELAQIPLKWLLDGAHDAGLECESFDSLPPPAPPMPVDSYAAFAKPLWTYVIRGKRFYRTLGPDPEIRASRPKADGGRGPGFSLRSINEHVDDSALERVCALDSYRPPNVAEYLRRKDQSRTSNPMSNAERQAFDAISRTTLTHAWLGETVMPYAVLVAWASCAALGLLVLSALFMPDRFDPTLQAGGRGVAVTTAVFALFFVQVDYWESRINFQLALRPSNPPWRAFLDSIYWTRTIGVLLFVVGAVSVVLALGRIGWNAERASIEQPWRWLPGPLFAGLSAVLANAIDHAPAKRHKAAWLGWAGAVVAAIFAVPGIVTLAWMVQHIVTPTIGNAEIPGISAAPNAEAAGLLLLLEFGLIYLAVAFRWVGEPMGTANLGSIRPLQKARTPAQVKAVLEGWRQLLVNHWSPDDEFKGPAALALRDVLRRALWRDIIGLIPVYALVLGFAAWYATHLKLPVLSESIDAIAQRLGWGHALTIAIVSLPGIAALTDWLEDACHLRYLKLHEAGQSPALLLTRISSATSLVKNVAFGLALVLALFAFVVGSFQLARIGPDTGWRGTAALLVALVIGGSVAATIVAIVWQWAAQFFPKKSAEESLSNVVASAAVMHR
jgi:uncharacterized protein (DUF2235 family)